MTSIVRDEMLFVRDVARACGVSADTIRHYERKGVVPAVGRDQSGYRRYPLAVVERVRIIRRALALGFTLDEIARIFRQRASGRPPCREVRELAVRKLTDIEEQIVALTALRGALKETISSWDERLDGARSGSFAELLTSLGERNDISTDPRRPAPRQRSNGKLPDARETHGKKR